MAGPGQFSFCRGSTAERIPRGATARDARGFLVRRQDVHRNTKGAKSLAGMALARLPRLSVQPVSEVEWRIVCQMGGLG